MDRIVNTVVPFRIYLGLWGGESNYLSLRVASLHDSPYDANSGSMKFELGDFQEAKGRGYFVWHGKEGYFSPLQDWEINLIKNKLMPAYRNGKLPNFGCPCPNEKEDDCHKIEAWNGLPLHFMGMRALHLGKKNDNPKFNCITFRMHYHNQIFLDFAVKEIARFTEIMGYSSNKVLIGKTFQEIFWVTEGVCLDPAKYAADKANLGFAEIPYGIE